MALTLLRDRQYTAPAAAAAASITPSGSAWGNSAYVTVLDPTPAALVLTGVIVCTEFGDNQIAFGHEWEVDIATGPAASEVVIGTVRGCNVRDFDSQSGPTLCCVLPIPIDNIAAGVRVSARLRKNNTNTSIVQKVAITYLKKPLLSTILTTAVPQTTLPAAAEGILLTAGSPAYANGSWVQLRAATGAALIVTGLAMFGNADGSYEVDLGTGSAASEVVITTIRVSWQEKVFPGLVMLPIPLDNIAAATRVAARIRCSTAGEWFRLGLMVVEKPL